MAPTVNCFKGRFDRHSADNSYSMEWRQRRAENAKRQPSRHYFNSTTNEDRSTGILPTGPNDNDDDDYWCKISARLDAAPDEVERVTHSFNFILSSSTSYQHSSDLISGHQAALNLICWTAWSADHAATCVSYANTGHQQAKGCCSIYVSSPTPLHIPHPQQMQ